jgi:hypothetical protein
MRQHHCLKANRAAAQFRQMHLALETKDSRSSYFIPGEFVDLEAGIFTQRSWSVQVIGKLRKEIKK